MSAEIVSPHGQSSDVWTQHNGYRSRPGTFAPQSAADKLIASALYDEERFAVAGDRQMARFFRDKAELLREVRDTTTGDEATVLAAMQNAKLRVF